MKVIAIDGHPREEELVAYVSDTLAEPDALRLEAHVFECPVCSARLERAARFEVLLHDAAAAMEAAPRAPAVAPTRRPWHVALASGLAAAAAAAVLVLGPHAGLEVPLGEHEASETSRVAQSAEIMAGGGASFIERDVVTSDVLVASVEPLESIDPLQTWPDDPRVAGGATDDALDGEPCGSGEDGGPLVCQPFSG